MTGDVVQGPMGVTMVTGEPPSWIVFQSLMVGCLIGARVALFLLLLSVLSNYLHMLPIPPAERDEGEFARLSQLGDVLGLSQMDVYQVRAHSSPLLPSFCLLLPSFPSSFCLLLGSSVRPAGWRRAGAEPDASIPAVLGPRVSHL